MLTKLYWNNCTLARLESQPIDSFWIEATRKEAETLIYPYCSSETIVQSRLYGESDGEIAAKIGDALRSYCFLTARDLSTVKAFPVYYPYSPMWKAHSPFKKVAPQKLSDLFELKNIATSETDNFSADYRLSLLA